ncbi:hypothetical protein Pla163_03520 [Planctomycetes bacterium Pla163]|uniref:Lipopolysaccharide assembly protein A domain-containing protein n=1 Tax=Rohdeia mirabilis TaxID=2528008 RepID=A0A518CVL9_9BACT|nr:hypothetical protein Pla163_03520 [Planctomycetes bacterium Pla163]
MKKVRHTAAIVLAVLAVIVVFQNTESVKTELLFATVTMPLALLLFVTLLIGGVCGLIVGHRWAKNGKDAES